MARPLTDEHKQLFLEFCKSRRRQKNSFTIDSLPEELRTVNEDDGESEWEFHAANYDPDDTYDWYELFASASDHYDVEIHGYDEFYVIPKPKTATKS